MGRHARRIISILVLVIGFGALFVYDRLTSLETQQISDDVHIIRGYGGNVAVLATDEGAVVVDTMSFRRLGGDLHDLASKLGGGPPLAILNTHYHSDHTHGNPGFAPGIRVVATDRTLGYLQEWDADYWNGTDGNNLPNDTFTDQHTLEVGGKTVRAHYFGRGHTGGDLVVLFVEDGVIHVGDLLFQRLYPNIDLGGGGSLPGWIAVIDRILELDFEHVVPGHGELTDRDGLRAFQAFLREVWTAAEAAAGSGVHLDEFLAAAELQEDAGYDVLSAPFQYRFDRESVLTAAWLEATGAAGAWNEEVSP